MKRTLSMLLVVVLSVCLGAFFTGCWHGNNADPYATGNAGEPDWGDLTDDAGETIPLGIIIRNMVDDTSLDSMQVFVDVLTSIGFRLPYVKPSKVYKVFNYVPLKHSDISLIKEGVEGGFAVISGDTITVSDLIGHCVVIANLSINYSSYSPSEDTIISGMENARIIASSYACEFYRNMHVDFKMSGNVDVNGETIQELEFSADFTDANGVDIMVDSAILDTTEGIRYCFYYEDSGETECSTFDLRTFEYENMIECSDEGIVRRECDPSIDSFYTQTYLLRGTLYTYEALLRCSEDGLWTPPCPLDGSNNTCPLGGKCYTPDDEGWGYRLEDYGYCSCSDPTAR